MGAWPFVHARLHSCLPERLRLRHVSRAESASPAIGTAALHQLEQSDLLRRVRWLNRITWWWTGRTWPPKDEPLRAWRNSTRRSGPTRPKILARASSWSSMRPSSIRVSESEREKVREAMLDGEMVSPPAGAIGRGDAFVLRIAERTNAIVLSNDSFQEFHGEHPWLFDEGRLVGGKPVPGVGWIFTPRLPIRGPEEPRCNG